MHNPAKLSLDYERLFTEGHIKKESAFRNLVVLFRGQYGNLLISLFFFLLKHSPVWVIPMITADMINTVTQHNADGPLHLWTDLGLVALVIIQNIPTQLIHVSFMSRSSRQLEAGLRGTLIRKLQHLSMSYHSELRAGKLQSKVLRDVEAVESLSKQIMYSFVPAILNVIVALTITLVTNLTVAAFFGLAAPVALAVLFFFRNSITSKNREFRKQIENISGQVAETVEMIPVTRAHGLDEVEIEKIDRALRTLKGKGYRLDIAEAIFGASGWVVFTLFQMACLGFTCSLAYAGQMPVGDVVMYQGLFTTIMGSINQMLNVYPQFAKGFESLHSVSEVLLSDETEEYQGSRKLTRLRGEFRFENVDFTYGDVDKNVLKNFNLTVSEGECIAFVGESGAGKSTVLNLVTGFYKPTKGRVLVDGVPMDTLQMNSYRQSLAVVPQNTILFSGTILENICYGLTDVTEEKVLRVVEMANLQDVIAEMPDGLDTMIGEHGSKLSGGQRQRIAIARAMIRDPRVILLDEATSALDNISEYRVQQAMGELIRDRTTFIVAHRLSTIRDAARIVVMKNGECVEVGTYDELVAQHGEFYRLKELQG